MYRENYLESLRNELVQTVEKKLSPMALKYHYADVALENNIKWRPVVLVLGNYSSGKSTLINELLGGEIQATGQAPTDDSFTVICSGDQAASDPEGVRILEQRDGKVLLFDEQYPFKNLRKHGERFAAHFKLLKVSSPFLRDLALIDTPGMLDSSSERDRGYDYQQVIGDLAQVADLILVLFDPHKAGTIRETHLSLRETLPNRTFEDRVIFVLNRIDECSHLNDLLRVYGTLCWNLSSMTGRKDIPPIHLTYSDQSQQLTLSHDKKEYLHLLSNQRSELRSKILSAPRHRLDHLASYIETHGERIAHLVEALHSYAGLRWRYKIKFFIVGLFLSTLVGSGVWLVALNTTLFQNAGETAATLAAASVGIIFFVTLLGLEKSLFLPSFHRQRLSNLEDLTELATQARKDSWQAISHRVEHYLKISKGNISRARAKSDWGSIQKAYQNASQNARSALAELGRIRINGEGVQSQGIKDKSAKAIASE